jgi:hypothetical protein
MGLKLKYLISPCVTCEFADHCKKPCLVLKEWQEENNIEGLKE